MPNFKWTKHLPYSSFHANDMGWILYGLVRALKPKRLLELGVLHGYSTMFIAAAMRDNGNEAQLMCVDLFKRSTKTKVADRLLKAGLYTNIALITEDAAAYLADIDRDQLYDFVLVDLDNDGERVEWAKKMLRPRLSKRGLLVIEGGAAGRDTIPWMLENKHLPTAQMVPLDAVVIDAFPGLIIMGANEQG
jgi:predicted O-methyltransferase YrrM